MTFQREVMRLIEGTFHGHQIRLQQLQNRGWKYIVEGRLMSEKTYRSEWDAASDAIDLLIILDNRGPMTGDELRSLLAALDTTLVEGYAAVDAVGRVA
jgi:hypothetical protein